MFKEIILNIDSINSESSRFISVVTELPREFSALAGGYGGLYGVNYGS